MHAILCSKYYMLLVDVFVRVSTSWLCRFALCNYDSLRSLWTWHSAYQPPHQHSHRHVDPTGRVQQTATSTPVPMSPNPSHNARRWRPVDVGAPTVKRLFNSTAPDKAQVEHGSCMCRTTRSLITSVPCQHHAQCGHRRTHMHATKAHNSRQPPKHGAQASIRSGRTCTPHTSYLTGPWRPSPVELPAVGVTLG